MVLRISGVLISSISWRFLNVSSGFTTSNGEEIGRNKFESWVGAGFLKS
jgi:hypothetical protein